MVDLACVFRRLLGLVVVPLTVVVSLTGWLSAQAVVVSPRWAVTFSLAGHLRETATAAMNPEGNLFVTVLPSGGELKKIVLKHGNLEVPVRDIMMDPVSRLAFLVPEAARDPHRQQWLEKSEGAVGETFTCAGLEGPVIGTSQGWVKQLGGKVLPFALLRISFDEKVPYPGTSLVDASGRVAALMFQTGESGKAGYAIPAEAVRRVQQDMIVSGKLVRGWLGITLLPENEVPRVVKVIAGSPADRVGIRPDDVLVQVGSREVMDYADAANAFFYLVPEQSVCLKFLRGNQRWEITAIAATAGE